MVLQLAHPIEELLAKVNTIAIEAERMTPPKPLGRPPKKIDQKTAEILKDAQEKWNAGRAIDRMALAEKHGLTHGKINYILGHNRKRRLLVKPDRGVSLIRKPPLRVADENHELVTGNLPLVDHWIREFRLKGSDNAAALKEVGQQALVRAAQHWDEKGSAKFGTYASVAIINAFIRFRTRNKNEVSYRDSLTNGKSAEEEYVERQEKEQQVAGALDLINTLLENGTLKEREAMVFLLRKLHGVNLKAIGLHPEFNITRERVRKIEAKATKKIREAAKRKSLWVSTAR